jgi:hypothetical protein
MSDFPPGYLEGVERNTRERIRKNRERVCRDLEAKYGITLSEVEQHLHLLTTTEQIILRLRFDTRFETPMPVTQFPGYAEALAKYKVEEAHYFNNGGDPKLLPTRGGLELADVQLDGRHGIWLKGWRNEDPDPRRASERQRVSRPNAILLLRINSANPVLQPSNSTYGREFRAYSDIVKFIGLTAYRCSQITDVAFKKIVRALGR